ncbi:L-asparaginase precursor [Lentithecium fluviatile CBS 122367]|uniref:L-asparaginase n=1 Tax=Lentithecium fluviatile CBS 122367 TaxID=1168545 RepID=A0A6G1IRV0_9PLEO|nr:L-asparaginase precursor [Lentithecium fluviatile CBS 122367]
MADKHDIPSQPQIRPRIIIHGGAGNITRQSISKDRYDAYQTSLRKILASSADVLSKPGATALDVATYAVSLLEDDPLYNSAKGAVFTRDGKNELECSIMVSSGYRKRSVGCMMIEHVKNPVKLARELLIRGETDDGDGSKDHCQYSGAFVEGLAKKWGLDIVHPSYFFTQQRWDEHKRGLKEEQTQKEKSGETDIAEVSDWGKKNYVPLGTCRAVVLDSLGTICVATSTGGLTNKVPGRIGDTPTTGAGFWAEEWYETASGSQMQYRPTSPGPLDHLSRGDIRSLVGDCLPTIAASSHTPTKSTLPNRTDSKPSRIRHAVGISGTGNGDSFIRLAAATTTASKSRFTPTSLSNALTWMTGPGGELQKSAGDRWDHSHEGTGGMIAVELVGRTGTVVQDYNCGGMFRAWTEENGEQKCLIFREDRYESGPKGWAAR